jgi:hypothetical protein
MTFAVSTLSFVHKLFCIETSLYKPDSCSSCLEYVSIFFLTAVRMDTSRTACVSLDRVGISHFFGSHRGSLICTHRHAGSLTTSVYPSLSYSHVRIPWKYLRKTYPFNLLFGLFALNVSAAPMLCCLSLCASGCLQAVTTELLLPREVSQLYKSGD